MPYYPAFPPNLTLSTSPRPSSSGSDHRKAAEIADRSDRDTYSSLASRKAEIADNSDLLDYNSALVQSHGKIFEGGQILYKENELPYKHSQTGGEGERSLQREETGETDVQRMMADDQEDGRDHRYLNPGSALPRKRTKTAGTTEGNLKRVCHGDGKEDGGRGEEGELEVIDQDLENGNVEKERSDRIPVSYGSVDESDGEEVEEKEKNDNDEKEDGDGKDKSDGTEEDNNDGSHRFQAGSTTHREKDQWKYRAPYRLLEDGDHFATKWTGHCHCGRVEYRLSRAKPLASKYCHCTTCQRLHGAPFQWAAIFHKTDILFTKGHHDLGWYDPSNKSTTHHLPCKVQCGYCRTPIMDEGRNMILLFPTLIEGINEREGKEAFEVGSHMFYGQRVVDIKDGVNKWEGLDGKSRRLGEDGEVLEGEDDGEGVEAGQDKKE